MNTIKNTAGVLFIALCLTLPFALMQEPQEDVQNYVRADDADALQTVADAGRSVKP